MPVGWVNENAYDSVIWPIAQQNGVSPYLIKAVIGAESAYNPKARRAEAPRDSLPPTPDFPKGGDESRGLMQLLMRTARALGYQGDLAGLDDPQLNIAYGARLLRDNFRRTSSSAALKGQPTAAQWDAAIAAYNAGWSKQRPGDAPRTGSTIATPFVNQVYVDRVRSYQKYFEDKARPGVTPPAPGGTGNAGSGPPMPRLELGCGPQAAAGLAIAGAIAALIL